MHEKHSKIFDEYNATFPAKLTKAWGAHVLKWNKNHKLKPDPYEEPDTRRFILVFSSDVIIHNYNRYLNEGN